MAIIAVVHADDMFAVELKSRCDVSRDELNSNEMKWRLSLHTGTGGGYSEDIPENVCR